MCYCHWAPAREDLGVLSCWQRHSEQKTHHGKGLCGVCPAPVQPLCPRTCTSYTQSEVHIRFLNWVQTEYRNQLLFKYSLWLSIQHLMAELPLLFPALTSAIKQRKLLGGQEGTRGWGRWERMSNRGKEGRAVKLQNQQAQRTRFCRHPAAQGAWTRRPVTSLSLSFCICTGLFCAKWWEILPQGVHGSLPWFTCNSILPSSAYTLHPWPQGGSQGH